MRLARSGSNHLQLDGVHCLADVTSTTPSGSNHCLFVVQINRVKLQLRPSVYQHQKPQGRTFRASELTPPRPARLLMTTASEKEGATTSVSVMRGRPS
jgi:hypothetical protein